MNEDNQVPEDNDTLVNIDELNINDSTFGVQYGYLLPNSQRVIPLPVGFTFEQAVAGVLNYNRATGRRTKKDRADLVERIVTSWVVAEKPDDEKERKIQARITKISTAFGVDGSPTNG